MEPDPKPFWNTPFKRFVESPEKSVPEEHMKLFEPYYNLFKSKAFNIYAGKPKELWYENFFNFMIYSERSELPVIGNPGNMQELKGLLLRQGAVAEAYLEFVRCVNVYDFGSDDFKKTGMSDVEVVVLGVMFSRGETSTAIAQWIKSCEAARKDSVVKGPDAVPETTDQKG